MIYHFNVTGPDRKKLANLIGEHIHQKPKYLGVPSCAYQIGEYNLSKEGALSWNDLDDADPAHMDLSCSLIQALEAEGFRSEEADFIEEQTATMAEVEETTVSISMPAAMFDEAALENLKRLVEAKKELIKRAFLAEDLPVEISEETVSFPWFKADPDAAESYAVFIQKICEMAITQKRINKKETKVVNEKYEFRCFLLRLGLIGDEYKKVRKQLMKNLSGSAAFKCGHKKGGEQE